MLDWKSLNLFKKNLLTIIITLLAIMSPELMLFIDVGGIEMALSFLLLYYKPVIVWFQNKIDDINDFLSSCKHLIVNSSIIKTKVFISHSIAATLTMIFTGSLFISLSPLVPVMFISGVS